MFYFDTSALIKKYVQEKGRDQVLSLLNETDHVLSSSFTELETASFVERAKRESLLDSPTYRQVVGALERDWREGGISAIAVTGDILAKAKNLIRQRKLRPADAVQLASALAALRSSDSKFEFVSADHALLEAARLEGLKCRDVSSD